MEEKRSDYLFVRELLDMEILVRLSLTSLGVMFFFFFFKVWRQ